MLKVFFFSFFGGGWDWFHFVRRPPFGLVYQHRMIDDECGVVGGMRICRGNQRTRRKPASVPICPPQILHDLTWDRTRAAAVGSRRLTAWAMARPCLKLSRQNLSLLHSVQTDPEAHPASYPMGTRGVKRQGRVADHSPPSSAEVKKSEAIHPLPHMSSWHSA
jgi:hypothetical protein